jgi:hypothetical protein
MSHNTTVATEHNITRNFNRFLTDDAWCDRALDRYQSMTTGAAVIMMVTALTKSIVTSLFITMGLCAGGCVLTLALSLKRMYIPSSSSSTREPTTQDDWPMA